MTIVTTREFRANQSYYLAKALRGEDVILKSRKGKVRLVPAEDEEPKRDVTTEICQAMKDWKEYLETGTSDKFMPAKDLINELRDIQTQGF